MKLSRLVGAAAAGVLFWYFATQSAPAAIGGLAATIVFLGFDLEGKITDIKTALEMHSKRIFPELWS